MLQTGSYVKQMKSKQFFEPSSVIYTRAQVITSTIANICWLIQTFKYQCCGFQVHFESILVYNLNTKSDFWSECLHYIMGYIINLGSMFFLFSLVLNLAYTDYSFCQIWSVYKQYLRCCDHSNKCLFLVIQQAEVLLSFFVGVSNFAVSNSLGKRHLNSVWTRYVCDKCESVPVCAKWQWNALNWCYWIALPASPDVQSSNTVRFTVISHTPVRSRYSNNQAQMEDKYLKYFLFILPSVDYQKKPPLIS